MESITISPLALFLQAGIIGKGVMLLLLAASVWCWVLIAEGALALRQINRTLKENPSEALVGVIETGRVAANRWIAGEAVGERRLRIQDALNRAGRAWLSTRCNGLSHLAIIASVAPFIGLFGTVWGIMTSFAGIAELKDTSLAVVAPGIAEALAATAYGLAAAIPASVGYTRLGAGFSAATQRLGDRLEEAAVELVETSGAR